MGRGGLQASGNSIAYFVVNSTSGEAAVDAWKRQYGQLEILIAEVIGVESFMHSIAWSLKRDDAQFKKTKACPFWFKGQKVGDGAV